MEPIVEKPFVQVQTRISGEAAERLQAIATAERRSLSAQLLVIIDWYFADLDAQKESQ